MSVVIVDRNQIVADRQNTMGAIRTEGSKLHLVDTQRWGRCAVGFTGSWAANAMMLEWLRNGMDPGLFPKCQETDGWSRAIILTGEGDVFIIDHQPVPMPVLDLPAAFGAGCEFAYGALGMQATLADAVRATNDRCIYCGFGVEGLDRKEGPEGATWFGWTKP